MNIDDRFIFLNCEQHFSNFKPEHSVRVLFDKIAPVCILFEKYIYILAFEMASPGNRHCTYNSEQGLCNERVSVGSDRTPSHIVSAHFRSLSIAVETKKKLFQMNTNVLFLYF